MKFALRFKKAASAEANISKLKRDVPSWFYVRRDTKWKTTEMCGKDHSMRQMQCYFLKEIWIMFSPDITISRLRKDTLCIHQ